jgi:hypothetical protein
MLVPILLGAGDPELPLKASSEALDAFGFSRSTYITTGKPVFCD